MTRTVFANDTNKSCRGLLHRPFLAPGQEIFETISQAALDDWQAHQTMLINEKHLNMMDKAARKYLTSNAIDFSRAVTWMKRRGISHQKTSTNCAEP